MDAMWEAIFTALILLPFASAALLLAGWRGWFRFSALTAMTSWPTGVRPVDLPLAILIFYASQIILVSILAAVGFSIVAPAAPGVVGQQATAGFDSLTYAGGIMLAQLGGFLPVAVLLGWRVTRCEEGVRNFGLRGDRLGRDVAWGLAALLWVFPVLLLVTALVSILGFALGFPPPSEVGHEMLIALRGSDSPLAIAMMLASAIVIAPVTEEILFRGLAQSALRGALPMRIVLLLSAGIFTVVHVGAAAPHTLPALFVLGLTLGWVYERSGSLVPGIVAHAGFNAVNVALTLWMV